MGWNAWYNWAVILPAVSKSIEASRTELGDDLWLRKFRLLLS